MSGPIGVGDMASAREADASTLVSGSVSPVLVERVAEAIERAEFGYSLRLTRLVDEDATYTLYIPGEDPREYPDTDEAYAYIAERKREGLALAAIEATGALELLAAAKRLSALADEIWVQMSDGENALMREAWAAMDAAIANAEGRP